MTNTTDDDLWECSACGGEYQESTFDEDLDKLVEASGAADMNQPPANELDEAITNSGGRRGMICPKCFRDAMGAAWKLVEEHER